MSVLNFFDVLAMQPDFFDDAYIDERIDKKVLADSILRRCGTLLPLYTDTRLFKYFSNTFFYERSKTIEKLVDTVYLEYNPIHNYDNKETITRETTLQAGIGSKSTTIGSNNETHTLGSGSTVTETPNTTQETTQKQTTDGTQTKEEQVSAFDSSSYQPKSKETTNDDTTVEGTNKTVTSGTNKTVTTQNGSDTIASSINDTVTTERNGSDVTSETITTEKSGNIGVTTTQKMITDERKVALFSVYQWIAIEFEQNFFICVS